MASKLFSVTDLAKRYGYDRSNIVKLVATGKLTGQKLGSGRTSAWVFTQKDIDAYEAKKAAA